MKKMSIECEVVECAFKTPTLDVKEYAAMVRHLQVLEHSKVMKRSNVKAQIKI